MRPARPVLLLAAATAALALAGCKGLFSADDFLPDVDLDSFGDITGFDPTVGAGVGGACDADAVPTGCRFGLRCVDAACAPDGETPAGRPCLLTDECADGLHCGFEGVCSAAGAGGRAASCTTPADCQRGLVCKPTGFSGACVEAGRGDVGAPCGDLTDCLAGLACREDGTCGPGSLVFGFKPWPGAACDDADPGDPRVYFELPRAGVGGDFFRLPFPNDIRVKADGHLDLSGFPTPGPGLVGFDVVKRVIDAAEAVERGFSTAPVVTFRFSAPFELNTVWAAGVANPPAGEPTLWFVDITPESPGFNTHPAYGYVVTDGRTPYICPRYLAVRPSWDSPLRPETTYAVILARGVKTPDGVELVPDADFQGVMASTRPADAASGRAWDAYAPLRAYLAREDALVAADRVIAAAVFTTQAVDRELPKIREALRAQPPTRPKALTLCDEGVVSPCDDGLTGEDHVRGCFRADAAVTELHMRVPIPRVQKGSRPYLDPEDGGGLVIGADGRVLTQGNEDVCVSLTVPKGAAMPAGGWPVAFYGHGTGGSFRSAVRDAGIPLSHVMVGDTEVGVAVVGWDGPMHGERRSSDLPPDGLFYNFANPVAARGNVFQGAADVFSLVYTFEHLEIAAVDSPTGEAIRFDPGKFAIIGHSQGSATGPLAAAYEPLLKLDVWSGAGAGLVLGLLHKTSPVDVAAGVAVALQELTESGPAPVGDLHPALALLQGLFDPVDPMNHLRRLMDDPRGRPMQHVLHTYGLGDTFTPPVSARVFTQLLRAQVATPVLDDFGVATVTPPVVDNIERGGERVTGVEVQAAPNGYDGHFVLFRDPGLQRQFQQFVGTWVKDGKPILVAR